MTDVERRGRNARPAQLIRAREIRIGDQLPSNRGTFNVIDVTYKGGKIIVHTVEQTPEGTAITFSASELVSVNR